MVNSPGKIYSPNVSLTQMGYCYILNPGDIKKQSVYKIGKTDRPVAKRLKEYPEGSKLIKSWEVPDCHTTEKRMIKFFKQKYVRHSGLEYFEGEIDSMLADIETICDDTKDLPVPKVIKTKGSTRIKMAIPKSRDGGNICVCGVTYRSRSGLNKHKKKCKSQDAVNNYDQLAEENKNLVKHLKEANKKIAQLERLNNKLDRTNDKLSSTNDKLGNTNDKLQCTNDKLQSINDTLMDKVLKILANKDLN